MDLAKIGKYIAEKRKALGMTQKQLAEQLGMSDKSVSKWERGICLPDVSVYLELCRILGISINEFLAGEDISDDNLVSKSEDNLIQVAKDSKTRQMNLKRIITALSVTVAVVVVILGGVICHFVNQPKDEGYITALDADSAEMQTARLLSDINTAFLYSYLANEEPQSLGIYLTVYHDGNLISTEQVADLSMAPADELTEGMIAVVPDYENYTVKLIIEGKGIKASTSIPILENVENREAYARSATQIDGKTAIQYDTEQRLLTLIFDDDIMAVPSIDDIEDKEISSQNDYMYCFSFQFSR